MADEHSPEENEHDSETEEHGDGRSDLDLMGQDKRRTVVGGQYGATVRKQLTVYGIFIALVVGVGYAAITVVGNIDGAEIPLEDTGPWTLGAGAEDPPRDVDFPCNGPDNTIPRDEIGEAVAAADSDQDLVESC